MRLKNSTSGHVRVVNCKSLRLVIYGLNFVVTIWGDEEERKGRGVACEHVAELWGSATVVDAEGVVDWSCAALRAAVGGGGEWEVEEGEEEEGKMEERSGF